MTLKENLPKIALGAWAWGNDGTFGNEFSPKTLRPIFETAMKNGLNLWDTAYAYGMGTSTKSQYRVLDGSVFKVRNTYNLGQIELKVVPVVTYELSSHFGMDLYVNLLSLAYRRTTTNYMQPVDIPETPPKNVLDHTLTTSDFDIGIQSLSSDLLSIGLYYSF